MHATNHGSVKVTDEPVELDTHRDLAEQKSIAVRRKLIEVRADQSALRDRQEEFERFVLNMPAETWPEAAARAELLVRMIVDMPAAQDACCQELLAEALDVLTRLSDHANGHK